MSKIVVGILEHGGHILLARRRRREGLLEWQFPGGQVRHGESEERAVEREILEEVGIECKCVERLGERVHPNTGRVVAYWRCTSDHDRIELRDKEELAEAAWFLPNEVFSTITSDVFEGVSKYLRALEDS